MRSWMRCEELSDLCLLLIFRKVLNAIENANQFADRIIGPVNDGHSRTLFAVFLPGVDGKNLILFGGIEAQMAMSADFSIFVFFAAENQAAVFRPLFVQKEHTRCFAIRM